MPSDIEALGHPALEAERFRLYELRRCPECDGTGQASDGERHCYTCKGATTAPVCVAACSKQAIGTAIVTLAADREEAGLPPAVIGIKDDLRRKWLTSLWHPTGGEPA